MVNLSLYRRETSSWGHILGMGSNYIFLSVR